MTQKTYQQSSYAKKLLDPRWQKKRLEIMQRDGFSCVKCRNDKLTLHIHHISYNNNPWDADNTQLETLCAKCHENEHFTKTEEDEFTYEHEEHKSVIEIDIKEINYIGEYDENGNIKYHHSNKDYPPIYRSSLLKPPIVVTAEHVLTLEISYLNIKNPPFSASLQWHFRQLIKYEQMSELDFIKENLGDCDFETWKSDYIQIVNRDCVFDNVLIKRGKILYGVGNLSMFKHPQYF